MTERYTVKMMSDASGNALTTLEEDSLNLIDTESVWDAADWPFMVLDGNRSEDENIMCIASNELEAKHVARALNAMPYESGERVIRGA